MKKNLSVIILIITIISMPLLAKATTTEMSQLRLKVTESSEEYDIYILLPKKYIKYAIQYDGLDIVYDGVNTLKYNSIPSIIVDINKIEEDTYVENGIEYVQIKLDDLGEEEYLFEIISEYTDMDMLYRVKSSTRDNIMIIDKFQFKNNKCEIEYNYQQNIVKTEKNQNVTIRFNLEWWQIVTVIILILLLVYAYRRMK